jgi:hypothetical protein
MIIILFWDIVMAGSLLMAAGSLIMLLRFNLGHGDGHGGFGV